MFFIPIRAFPFIPQFERILEMTPPSLSFILSNYIDIFIRVGFLLGTFGTLFSEYFAQAVLVTAHDTSPENLQCLNARVQNCLRAYFASV